MSNEEGMFDDLKGRHVDVYFDAIKASMVLLAAAEDVCQLGVDDGRVDNLARGVLVMHKALSEMNEMSREIMERAHGEH